VGGEGARRNWGALAALGAATVLLAGGGLLSLAVGPWHLTLGELAEILLTAPGSGNGLDPAAVAVVWYGRVPRALAGALVGFALGAAGAVMQGVFKNPMASPGVIGTSSGAALGAVTAIYLGLGSRSLYAVPVLSILFAFGSLLLVLGVATTGGLTSRYTLLLAGIAFNAMFSALTSVVLVLSTDRFEMARQVVGWLMGDLTNRTWEHVQIIGAVALVGLAGALLYARDLNIIMISEEMAANLGVRVAWSRNLLLFFSALLTGGAIAVSGVIGFVGLVAPHVMRSFAGSDNRFLIPAAGLFGGCIVVYSDCLVRLFSEEGLRIGVLTALLGGPFFLYLILRDRKRYVYF